MPSSRINFGAAAIAALLSLACNGSSSTPKAAEASSAQPASAQVPRNLNVPDPEVTAADRGRIAGDSTAKTWVIIASDFQCPFCREWHAQTYKGFVNEYVRTGKVKVAYINYPLGQHRNAVITAQGALCAGVQKKFWEYHDALFESQAQWAQLTNPRPVLDSIARAVGVDIASWSRCIDSGRMVPLIMADRDRASAAGVGSTPTFLIGEHVLAGAQPLDSMRAALNAAIAKDAATSAR